MSPFWRHFFYVLITKKILYKVDDIIKWNMFKMGEKGAKIGKEDIKCFIDNDINSIF